MVYYEYRTRIQLPAGDVVCTVIVVVGERTPPHSAQYVFTRVE